MNVAPRMAREPNRLSFSQPICRLARTSRDRLLFEGSKHGPIHERNLVQRAFKPLIARAGLPGKGLDAYVAVAASGTFSESKRQAGLLRMLQAGVILSDYATLMVETLRDNARPEAGEVYGAMDIGWAVLVGQIAQAYGK